jgi:hypothetical protein
MKRNLLLVLALSASVTFAVTPKAGLKVVKQTNKLKPMINDPEVSLEKQQNLVPYAKPTVKPKNATIKSASSAITRTSIGSSANLLTALVAESNCLNANQDLNTIAYMRRKSTTTSPGNSGYIEASITTNGGATWDSLVKLHADEAHLGRYPTGAIFNPPGNTSPGNAYVFASGPWHPGQDWQGNYFGINKISTGSAAPTSVVVDNLALTGDQLKSDFGRISSFGTNQGIVVMMQMEEQLLNNNTKMQFSIKVLTMQILKLSTGQTKT